MNLPAECTPRRAFLGVAVAAGAACAGCSTYGASQSPPPSQPNPAAGGASAPAPGGSPASSSGAPPAGQVVLGQTSSVPVGGGAILQDRQIVLTQPTAGVFKAFTAVCTHAGCTVSSIDSGTIVCPCHGSRYHIQDGSVANGPASRPLAPIAITVSGGQILQS